MRLLKVGGAAGDGNADAGKLFNAGGHDGAGADDAAIGKAASAVSKVSGKQILHAIVNSGDGGGGKKASDATNPIEAAIGANEDDDDGAFGNEMGKDDNIAAALVLRGMAKDGKFALAAGAKSAIGNVADANNNGAKGDAESVKAIADGMKGIVAAAKKAGVELKVDGDAGRDNADAGKLFNAGGNGNNADDAAIGKAASAVSKVSGKQILSAIVNSGDGGGVGKKASEATNPIEAAIGAAENDDDNGAFGNGEMKKDDNIAAALVLRGMAKGGKFALANNAKGKESLKNAVESAVGWLKEMIDAAKKTGEKNSGADDAIGNVADANSKGAKGDAESVKAIADGMKGIVEAAKKAGVELKVGGAAGDGNADAGKLFNAGGRANADDAAIGKAASAVSKVSGKQILSAIVNSGGDGGKKASEATNPIEAAIGANEDDNNAFGNEMEKDDNIAAALVLRGMAKDGKFALADGAANGAIGNVADANNKGAQGNAESVKAIADGMKGIVEAAKKAGVELKVDGDAGRTNADAGKLFNAGGRNGAGADDEAIGKAASAVSKVSGKQILHAIVNSGGDGVGKKASDATNPIEAAIGANDDDNAGAFAGEMVKDDNIAAALVLRGMAKDGKFALAGGCW